jgi:hypothetical protein
LFILSPALNAAAVRQEGHRHPVPICASAIIAVSVFAILAQIASTDSAFSVSANLAEIYQAGHRHLMPLCDGRSSSPRTKTTHRHFLPL